MTKIIRRHKHWIGEADEPRKRNKPLTGPLVPKGPESTEQPRHRPCLGPNCDRVFVTVSTKRLCPLCTARIKGLNFNTVAFQEAISRRRTSVHVGQ